ncbi:COG3415 family protein [Anaerocolumna cellulosilytica]|uniref:hypothetical protein n=1 Tax=Anaerocolumna cellulosilytica TaxID=433286 RepID=UPI00161035B8|nr:hypothetical protein [Anaerocolumna cellulosilytica]MBB5197391.1 Mor family transcriptional regulator [Anaerocolumna cellulosilytica]
MNKNTENLKELRDIIGFEQFKVVTKLMPGKLLHISDWGGFISKEERDAAIRKDLYHNMGIPEIANKYGLGIHAIYKITEHKK